MSNVIVRMGREEHTHQRAKIDLEDKSREIHLQLFRRGGKPKDAINRGKIGTKNVKNERETENLSGIVVRGYPPPG